MHFVGVNVEAKRPNARNTSTKKGIPEIFPFE